MKSYTHYKKALALKDEACFYKNGKHRKIVIHEKMVLAKRYIDKAYKLTPICESVMSYTASITIWASISALNSI